MRRVRNLAFVAFGVGPLIACGGGAHAPKHSGGAGHVVDLRTASRADVYGFASISAAWFDGFAMHGQARPTIRATPEEIDAFLSRKSGRPSSLAMSYMSIRVAGR
jgi:hypothetical protein